MRDPKTLVARLERAGSPQGSDELAVMKLVYLCAEAAERVAYLESVAGPVIPSRTFDAVRGQDRRKPGDNPT